MTDNITVTDERDLGAFIPSYLDDFGLNPYQFRIYCRLARRAGAGGQCWESINNIAKACQINRKTVMSAISSLLNFGMVRQEKRPGKSDVYKLTSDKHWNKAVPQIPVRLVDTPKNTPVPHTDYTSPSGGHPQSLTRTTPVRLADTKVFPQGSSLSSPQELKEEEQTIIVETQEALGVLPVKVNLGEEEKKQTPQAAIDGPTASSGTKDQTDIPLATSEAKIELVGEKLESSDQATIAADAETDSNANNLEAQKHAEIIRNFAMKNFFYRTSYPGREALENWTVEALIPASPRERDEFLRIFRSQKRLRRNASLRFLVSRAASALNPKPEMPCDIFE